MPLRDMLLEEASLLPRLLMSYCPWTIPTDSWPSSSTPWTERTGENWALKLRARGWERRPIIPRC